MKVSAVALALLLAIAATDVYARADPTAGEVSGTAETLQGSGDKGPPSQLYCHGSSIYHCGIL
jgi:hypothetical protein